MSENGNYNNINRDPSPSLHVQLDAYTVSSSPLCSTDLVHNALTYPTTTDQSTRAMEMMEGRLQSGSIIETDMPQLYESSDIPGALQDPTAN